MTSRIIVLGGNGFLGSHLCDRLEALGYGVRSIARRGNLARREHYALDLFGVQDLAPLLAGADSCIHLANDVVPSSAEREGYPGLERNLSLAFRVADGCARAGVGRLVFASSGGTVYGRDVLDAHEDMPCQPIGLYGVQKLAIEMALRSRLQGTRCRLVNLRIGNPYGAGQECQRAHGLIGHLLKALVNDAPFTVWGDGSQVRDYIHVDDVLDVFQEVLNYSGDKDILNVGSGAGTSTNEMIELCQETVGRELLLTYAAHPSYDVDRISLNIQRAHEQLGWTPKIRLSDGVQHYLQNLLKADLS